MKNDEIISTRSGEATIRQFTAERKVRQTAKDLKWLRMCVFGANEFSTCGKRQYMSIITDMSGLVLGMGYNGGPPGMQHCNEGGCPRFLEGAAPGSNYDTCIAIHAEENALLHSDWSARANGGTLYVNGPPCFGCAKKICNSGLKRVVYVTDDSYADWPNVVTFFQKAGVNLVGVDPQDLQ